MASSYDAGATFASSAVITSSSSLGGPPAHYDDELRQHVPWTAYPMAEWGRHPIREFPVLQPDDWSCGPSVVKMALEAAGLGFVDLDELRAPLETTPEYGTPAAAIERFFSSLTCERLEVRTGEDFGFSRERPPAVDALRAVLQLGYIVIVLHREWNIGHYVIVNGFTPTEMILADPWCGNNRALPLSRFVWRASDASPHEDGWFIAVKPHGEESARRTRISTTTIRTTTRRNDGFRIL